MNGRLSPMRLAEQTRRRAAAPDTAFPLTVIAAAIAGIIVGLVVLGDPAQSEQVYVQQALR